MDVEKLLYLTMEGVVVRRLMSGNDAQCFTTEQYVDARDKFIAEQSGYTRESLGITGALHWHTEYGRRQLRASQLVIEVSPDVWTLRSLARPTVNVNSEAKG